jgi:hypothetical protein
MAILIRTRHFFKGVGLYRVILQADFLDWRTINSPDFMNASIFSYDSSEGDESELKFGRHVGYVYTTQDAESRFRDYLKAQCLKRGEAVREIWLNRASKS